MNCWGETFGISFLENRMPVDCCWGTALTRGGRSIFSSEPRVNLSYRGWPGGEKKKHTLSTVRENLVAMVNPFRGCSSCQAARGIYVLLCCACAALPQRCQAPAHSPLQQKTGRQRNLAKEAPNAQPPNIRENPCPQNLNQFFTGRGL